MPGTWLSYWWPYRLVVAVKSSKLNDAFKVTAKATPRVQKHLQKPFP